MNRRFVFLWVLYLRPVAKTFMKRCSSSSATQFSTEHINKNYIIYFFAKNNYFWQQSCTINWNIIKTAPWPASISKLQKLYFWIFDEGKLCDKTALQWSAAVMPIWFSTCKEAQRCAALLSQWTQRWLVSNQTGQRSTATSTPGFNSDSSIHQSYFSCSRDANTGRLWRQRVNATESKMWEEASAEACWLANVLHFPRALSIFPSKFILLIISLMSRFAVWALKAPEEGENVLRCLVSSETQKYSVCCHSGGKETRNYSHFKELRSW